MKKLLLVLTLQLVALFSFAQKEIDQSDRFSFRVNAGTTFTLVQRFNNRILVAPQGIVLPGHINPDNALSLVTVRASSTTRSLLGWHAEAEVHYKLPHNFSLSVGAGVKKMRFDYTSKFTFNQSHVDMDDIDRKFGETSLLYLSVAPNISKELGSRLILQAGPVFSWLLNQEVNNMVAIYYTPEAQANRMPNEVYFDTMGNMRKMIWGLNFGSAYKIVGPLFVKASIQYYVNSIYDKKSYANLVVEKVTPFTLQAGVGYAF